MDKIKYIWSFADNGLQIPEYNRAEGKVRDREIMRKV